MSSAKGVRDAGFQCLNLNGVSRSRRRRQGQPEPSYSGKGGYFVDVLTVWGVLSLDRVVEDVERLDVGVAPSNRQENKQFNSVCPNGVSDPMLRSPQATSKRDREREDVFPPNLIWAR